MAYFLHADELAVPDYGAGQQPAYQQIPQRPSANFRPELRIAKLWFAGLVTYI